MRPRLAPLPIDAVLDDIGARLAEASAVVLRAPTGAGKTTRVPPRVLAELGVPLSVVVVEPRRVAARAAAARVAAERGWKLGDDVGYRIRFDDRTSASTRLLYVTEGVLLAWVQRDPFLEGVGAVIFDEFHERNLASDLGLAMVERLRRTVREDLRLIVMSATLDSETVSSFLGDCPITESEGRLHAVTVEYLRRPDERPLWVQASAAVLRELAASAAGDLLVLSPFAAHSHPNPRGPTRPPPWILAMQLTRTALALISVATIATAQATPAWSKQQQKGCDFLMAKQKDGVFSVQTRRGSFPDPGFTSLAIAAIQSKPKDKRSEAEQATIDNGLRWVLKNQNEDGSFGRNVPNYTTCAAVMALSRWHDQDAAKDALAKAQKYVLMIQKCEQNGTQRSDVEYGGVGYSSKGERSDLSNMQFAISALRQSNLDIEHEAFQRTLVFLQRVQNRKESNDLDGKMTIKTGEKGTAKLSVGDDGGAVYYPGESPAGYVVNPDGSATPRSYGSMTYALLKTYTLCGVDTKDPRVQAAIRWIDDHWTVTENPGADPSLGTRRATRACSTTTC